MNRSYQAYRPSSIRLALLVTLFLVASLSLGAALAQLATEIVPVSAASSACVVSAPSVAPAVVAAPIILTIKPQPVEAESQPIIEPKRVKVRYAKAVHGRVRGRFSTRD